MSCDAALRVSSSIPAVRIANLDSTRRFLEVKQLGCQRASPARESQDSTASGVPAGGRHAVTVVTPSRLGASRASHAACQPRGRPEVRPGGSGGAWGRARGKRWGRQGEASRGLGTGSPAPRDEAPLGRPSVPLDRLAPLGPPTGPRAAGPPWAPPRSGSRSPAARWGESPDLVEAVTQAVLESGAAHQKMSQQALGDPKVMEGLVKVLVNFTDLYDRLRERAGASAPADAAARD